MAQYTITIEGCDRAICECGTRSIEDARILAMQHTKPIHSDSEDNPEHGVVITGSDGTAELIRQFSDWDSYCGFVLDGYYGLDQEGQLFQICPDTGEIIENINIG